VIAARLLADHGAALREALERAFSLRGELLPLAGERDANLRLQADDGGVWLVKVMADATPTDDVELQANVLTHLAENAPSLPVPRLRRTADGAAFARMTINGRERLVWTSTWLDGAPFAELPIVTDAACESLGAMLGRLDRALADFDDARARRELAWDLRRAGWIGERLDAIDDDELRAVVADVHARFGALLSRLEAARTGVVHNDANDHNVLVTADGAAVCGLFDFGDLCETALVGEVAIAATYAAMRSDDPLAAIDAVVRGYDAELPLQDDELELVLPLVATRLAVSITNAHVRRCERPDDPYVTVSLAGASRLLRQLHGRDDVVGAARLRAACGRPALPAPVRVAAALREGMHTHADVLDDIDVADAPIVDLSFESLVGGDDPTRFDAAQARQRVEEQLRARGAAAAIGRYAEPRPIYTGPAFGEETGNARRRTVHLGVDVFAPADTVVRAPLDACVHHVAVRDADGDYGGLVVLRHQLPDKTPFGTLYGHLDPASIAALRVGQQLAKGAAFARLGDVAVNGGWPPHLHLQLLAADPALLPPVPRGVADPDDLDAHLGVHRDPSALLGLDDDRAVYDLDAGRDDRLADERRELFAGNLATSYRRPLALVRGWRHFVFDRMGRRHLDAYNNVPHVGHCHPHVVAAIHRQTALLATNTRYLHDGMHRYAERLRAWLPDELCVFFFTASGSEANELALRLAHKHTGATDVCVMNHGYHGHTTGTMAISPYKLCQRGAPEQPENVFVTVQPDVYRGAYAGPDAGPRYAADVAARIDERTRAGRTLAAYLCECLPSVGGQLDLPDGFLANVYDAVRAAGGVCVADDVQTGLWRTGEHAFGFQRHGVVPDVLVLGKPLGNGFPIGAVVTTRAVAASFADGPEFFSTFGGSTVAMAAGNAVLDVLEREDLAANARRVGDLLLRGLRDLQGRHEAIGDVRGRGLFVGVELVLDRAKKTPATRLAEQVRETLRQRRVLIGTDGPFDNVLKIRPPMSFDARAADLLLAELDRALASIARRSPR